jgi:WD40 repeat protein
MTADAGPAISRTSTTCGELFLLLVPGAGEDAGPGTTLGLLRAEVKSHLRWPRPKVGVVSWRNPSPTPRLLREVRAEGVHAAYFTGWLRAVRQTREALVSRVRRCPGEALMVMGYSQGAAIARVALQSLADNRRVTRRLASLVLVGDPMASAGQHAVVIGAPLQGLTGRTVPLPRLLARGGAVVSWCRNGDPVCSHERISRAGVRAHELYSHSGTGREFVRRNVQRAISWLQVFPTSGFVEQHLGLPMLVGLAPDHAPPGQRWSVEEGTLPGGLTIDGSSLQGTPVEETYRGVTFRTWNANIAPALHRTFKIFLKLYPAATARPGTVLVSTGTSELGGVSADGRYVVFSSMTALGPGDTNQDWDVFRFDRNTGATVLVSSTPAGIPADEPSHDAAVSADGRYVVFASRARELDPAAAGNQLGNIYVWDATTGLSTLVSRPNAGGASTSFAYQPWISDDGSQVVFRADAGNLVPDGQPGLVRWRRDTNQVERVALPGPGAWIGDPWVASADGRFVALAGDGSTLRIFDLQASTQIGTCTLPGPQAPVTVGASGGGRLSLDGHTLAGWFETASSEPHGDFAGRCDTATGTATVLLPRTTEALRDVDLSRDGAVTVTLDGDYPSPDGFRHLDVRAWVAGGSTSAFTTPAVSNIPHSDLQVGPLRVAVSGDGSVVAYEAESLNVFANLHPHFQMRDLFIWDRTVSP